MKTCWMLLFTTCMTLPACAQAPTSPPLQHGQIGTAAELAAQRGPATADPIHLRRDRVPPDLVDLIPLAEKWGIGDDLLRDEMQERATDAEKRAMADALKHRHARITAWLDSFPKGQPMTDEAAAFMYMQLGVDEMGLMQ
ncbi:hypothetical protein D7U98_04305 [Stenotrophomonas maltophilia]|uniref:Uncharacterized protein n=1 Tax=Stenotrophomonas maltophilia (strain R551-3) TaxID=391008 RepID=B4SKJ9_STRM5|nr:hypothetical protein [Stenotrophomonas maltophilia]ACF53306.1 hypothetical protein Smal_3607 [Stenotrophomonas maltophilia R551-3]MBA0394628.1 hypothetical protein [Stenotrophomonas maltophilia]MBN5144141.1 hypothetical protein [Stenotrophomonas maltophilia]PJL36621.1 hypothetical protein B9Y56_19300 [Stenotrophomonas maltophilia]QGL77888.1 hypothetical protein FEO95_20485 [Stenotrophomonas maltophilia]